MTQVMQQGMPKAQLAGLLVKCTANTIVVQVNQWSVSRYTMPSIKTTSLFRPCNGGVKHLEPVFHRVPTN